MSIHIGKNAIYNPNKVFRIESDNSNVLNLQSRTNKVNLNIQDFTLGQTSNIDKILNISTANTDLVSFKNDNITFYPEVFITSNVNITSNITISNNITITGKINTITDVINISDDGNINTNSLFASNINIFTDINKDVLVLGSNNENGFNTLFLISSSNNGEIYIKGNLGIGTEPSINDSIYVSSNVLVNVNTYTSNIYTNKISNRDITSVSGISFTEDTLYLTADNSVIINKYSLGTELNLDTLTVNERLDTNNLNVTSFININNDTNYPALLIKQGLTEEGLFVNSNTANPISVLSEFTNDRGNLSNIFQLSAKGHITLGGLYPDPENTNSEYMIRGDIRDDKLDYINGFINFTNCNIDKESFTITQDGHIGIGTQIPKGFLEIKNNYTEINDNYTKPDSILKLENNGTNIPFMKVLSSNNSIFEISSNATFNFIQEYDNGYNIVASNIYAPNINIDTIKSSSNIINLYNATLSNISHMDIGFIISSNVYIDGKLTITGTVNAANLSTNVVSVYKDGDYSELYFDNDKMLTNATGIAINVGTDHYSYSNSRITGVYLNTNRDVSDIRALHILGENSTIRNTVNNQNNRVTILDGDIFLQRNAKTYQEFNVNSNIFQIGIKNLSSIADTNASIYITSFNDEVTEDTIDVNNNNCALSINKNNEINIANNFFIDEVGKISVGYNGTSLEDNFNVKGDVRIVNDSNETLFIIENNGNIGFGTEQGQSRLHINTTTSNQDYFVVYDTNTNNTEFIIDKNNRIGIGTVNNTNAKLIIKGDIIPGENGVYTLGNDNNTWSNVYISNFIDINGITLENNEIGGIKIKEPIKQQLINYQYYNSNTSEYYQYYTNSNEMMNIYDNMIPKNSLNINNSDIYYNSTTDRVVNNLSLVSSPVNNNWAGISWASELGLFVAVSDTGTGDRVMTSPDGIIWTTRSNPVDNNWRSVTWAPELGLLVAVAYSGSGDRVMTSSDGITWTTRSTPVDNGWYDITWAPELGLLVAIAYTGTGNSVMTSPDGINWTTRTTPIDNGWKSITWAPELKLFVAVSDTAITYTKHPIVGLTANTTTTSFGTYIVSASSEYTNYNAYEAFDGIHTGADPGNAWTADYTNSQYRYNGGGGTYSGTSSLGGYSGEWIKLQLPYNIILKRIRIYPRHDWPNETPNTGVILASNNGTTWSLLHSFSNEVFTADTPKYFEINATTEYSYYALVATAVQSAGSYLNIGEIELISETKTNILTSPDGINWTTRTSVANNNWQSVTWAPELKQFVAVSSSGTGNRVMTSPDGINWTARKTDNQSWISVCWCPEINIFTTVSSDTAGQQLMTSPDGIVWTTRSSINYTSSYNSYLSTDANNRTIILNSYGIDYLIEGNISGLQMNGAFINPQPSKAEIITNTWNTSISGEISFYIGIYDGTYTKTALIVLRQINGNIDAYQSGAFYWTGNVLNSSSWTTLGGYPTGRTSTTSGSGGYGVYNIVINVGNNNWRSIVWSPELYRFVAVSNGGSYQILVSGNPNPKPVNSFGLDLQTGGGGLNVMAPVVNQELAWTTRVSAADNQWINIIWAPELGLFVAVAGTGSGDRVMTSSDGITWTTRSTNDNVWIGITWAPELGLLIAVALSGTGNRVMTSPDGINWTTRTSAADNEWMSITWAPELGLLVATSRTGTGNRVMTSPDGINWTTRTSAVDSQWFGITWAPELGLLTAVTDTGTGNRVMTSPDGINWTTRSTPVDNGWHDITWAPELGLLVTVSYVGTGNNVMTSPDGINWTTRSTPADNEWMRVTWAPELGLLVAVARSGTGNRVMTSPDGINWTTRSTPIDNQWWGITWAPELGLFAAVGYTGTGNRVMTAEGTKINKSLLTAKNDIVSIQGSLGIRTEPAINSGLTIRQSVSPNIINSSGHNLNVSPGIQLEGDVQKWGIFITGKDDNNNLVFTQAYKNLNYEGVCAYISRYESNLRMNFTGQHRCHIENINIDTLKQYEGLIVSANNNKYMNMVNGVVTGNKAITVNESLPIVNITSKNKDKSVFGVISSVEDTDKRDIKYGSFVTPYNKIQGDNRVFINSIGEGSIWISNKNGNIYSGEYITSSDIPGYGQKQEDDILHNYTVAKITMDCDFNPVLQPIQKIKISNSSNNINEPETDEYGNIVFEDTNEYEYSYEVRYLQKDGSIITQEDYNTLLSYGSNVYKAAFVGCTYHCG